MEFKDLEKGQQMYEGYDNLNKTTLECFFLKEDLCLEVDELSFIYNIMENRFKNTFRDEKLLKKFLDGYTTTVLFSMCAVESIENPDDVNLKIRAQAPLFVEARNNNLKLNEESLLNEYITRHSSLALSLCHRFEEQGNQNPVKNWKVYGFHYKLIFDLGFKDLPFYNK